MKPLLCGILSTVLLLSGCAPVDINKVVSDAVFQMGNAKLFVEQGKALAVEFKDLDPHLSARIADFSAKAEVMLNGAITAGNKFLSSPSDDNFQAILNAVDGLVSAVDAEVLQAARIVNPERQKRILSLLRLGDSALHISVGLVKNYAKQNQLRAMPKIAHVSGQQIEPYLDKAYIRQQLSAMGY